MKRMVLVGAVLGLAGLVTKATAAQGEFIGFGVGTHVSCGAFNAAVKDTRPDHHNSIQGKIFYPESSAYMQWVQGYITAINIARSTGVLPGPQINTDVDGIAASIAKYCADHPTDYFYEGMASMLYVGAVPLSPPAAPPNIFDQFDQEPPAPVKK